MRETLHILRKDLFGLHRAIAVTTANFAIAAWLDGFAWGNSWLQNIAPIIELVAIGIAGFLVAMAVHGEALPGSDQVWLTRPYHRPSLLAAKLLFFLVTVNLPVLLFQSLELIGQGYSPLRYWELLLGKQLLLAQFLVTTILLIAACTRTLAQAIWVVGLIMLWSIGRSSFISSCAGWGSWSALAGIEHYANAALDTVFCGAVIWFQYRTRRTRWTFVLLAVNVLLLPSVLDQIPVSRAAWSLQSSRTAGKVALNSGHISLRTPASRETRMNYGRAAAFLPIQFEPLNDDVKVTCESDEIAMSAGAGLEWSKGRDTACALYESADGPDLALPVDWAFVDAVGNKPVHLHARLYLVLLQRKSTVTLPPGVTRIRAPGDGICQRTDSPGPVNCFWPLRQPDLFLAIKPGGRTSFASGDLLTNPELVMTLRSAPLSAGAGVFVRAEFATTNVAPLRTQDNGRAAIADSPAVLENYVPFAFIERELDVREFELSQYVLARPASTATSWTIFTHFLKRLVPFI